MLEKKIAIEDKHSISRLGNICEFVKNINHFNCDVKLENEYSHYATDGRDIMQFLHLVTEDCDSIRATFDGRQEKEACEYVIEYFLNSKDYFD
ncbi:MAG: HPr family phosphocarrier protein [Candidatus Zixiibacteriota bacterium]